MVGHTCHSFAISDSDWKVACLSGLLSSGCENCSFTYSSSLYKGLRVPGLFPEWTGYVPALGTLFFWRVWWVSRSPCHFRRPHEVFLTQAQLEAQKATQDFQRATEVLRAAKETISLAEQRLLEDDKRQFDSAWQEMLNHATQRV